MSIVRYPIKGMSGEHIKSVALRSGEVISGDREFAFARPGILFDEKKPVYMNKSNFLALFRDEKLATLETSFEPLKKILSIHKNNKLLFKANLSNGDECDLLSEFVRKQLNIPIDKPPKLVRAKGGTKSHSFSDVPDKALSLINLASIREFGEKIGKKIDPLRFRANINIECTAAWREFDWIGHDLSIGEVLINVFKPTIRCAATTVNPKTAVRDINIPRELLKNYNHMDMGVYAKVIEGGSIKVGDQLKLIG